MADSSAERYLPLRPSSFAVLASLARGPRTGVEVLDAVSQTGVAILGPGTLYRLLRELRGSGWVERVPPPAGDGRGDDRTHYHALTPRGRSVLHLEATRLRRTLDQVGEREDPEAVG